MMAITSVTLPARREKDPEKFYWTVEFGIHETWVADGFDFRDEQALEMLSKRLPYAFTETELSAEVVSSPDLDHIAKEQGYKGKDDPRFTKDRR